MHQVFADSGSGGIAGVLVSQDGIPIRQGIQVWLLVRPAQQFLAQAGDSLWIPGDGSQWGGAAVESIKRICT